MNSLKFLFISNYVISLIFKEFSLAIFFFFFFVAIFFQHFENIIIILTQQLVE